MSHDKAVIARTLLSGRKCDGSNDAVTPLLHAPPCSGAWPQLLYMCLNGNQSAFEQSGEGPWFPFSDKVLLGIIGGTYLVEEFEGGRRKDRSFPSLKTPF